MAEITYLMDRDPGGANAFYTNAGEYFQARGSTVVEPTPAGRSTLEELFTDLRTRAAAGPAGIFDVINVVTHATGFSSLQFGLTNATRDEIIGAADLTGALAIASSSTPVLAQLGAPAVTDKTHIVLYGCDVGRDRAFLRDFGLMFGLPAKVSAPVRVAVFRHTGNTYIHRLARTWSVPWPSDITATPAANWANARATFIAAAVNKFGTVAAMGNPGDINAPNEVTAAITAAANAATPGQQGDSFFFAEYVPAKIPAGQNADAYVLTVAPSRTAVIGAELSDLSVRNSLGPADFTYHAGPSERRAYSAALAKIIDTEVSLTGPAQYMTVEFAPQKTPAVGPKPHAHGGPAAPPLPPAPTVWEQATDAFVAAGGNQADLDDLVAGFAAPVPQYGLSEPELTGYSEPAQADPTLEEADA